MLFGLIEITSTRIALFWNSASLHVRIGRFSDRPRNSGSYELQNCSVGAVVLFASSLDADLDQLIEKAKVGNSRLVAVLENTESPQPFLKHSIQGIIYRDVPQAEMIKCLRSVASGVNYIQQRSAVSSASFESDMVGERARDRLTRKELRIVGLILQGYANKDIAQELNNTEQVIKNYLRSIFDKTGVSGRLELALFAIHHRILSTARNEIHADETHPVLPNS
jgi:DNA-binding NarL/FixJ family response regulator